MGRVTVPRWLPNAITALRIALVPVAIGCAMAADAAVQRGDDGALARWWTVAALVAIGVSDLVDGFLARRFGLATQLGATLDALADKLAQVATITYFTLAASHAFTPLPLWFMLLLIGRDALLGAGWLYLRLTSGVHVEHRWHGKLASTLIFALVLWVALGGGAGVSLALVWTITGITLLSTAAYVRDGLS